MTSLDAGSADTGDRSPAADVAFVEPSSASERGGPPLTAQKSVVERVRSGANVLRAGASEFFGLADETDGGQAKERWDARRERHMSRRLGRVKTTTMADVVSAAAGPSRAPVSKTVSSPFERSSAASVLWRSASSKITTRKSQLASPKSKGLRELHDNNAEEMEMEDAPENSGKLLYVDQEPGDEPDAADQSAAPKRKSIQAAGSAILNRICSPIRSQANLKIDQGAKNEHRVYFTYWLTFVQVTIMIIAVSVYKWAPIGMSKQKTSRKIIHNSNGVLNELQLDKLEQQSIWLGPSLENLVLLGAKYAPCMRADILLNRKLAEERLAERQSGCCKETQNTGCIQRSGTDCTSSLTKFLPAKVCGLDPSACLAPQSIKPNEWNKDDFTKWPVCVNTVNSSKLDQKEFPHMTCRVTGRPCCIGTQGECIITNPEHCDFRGGKYNEGASLCSQVNCLVETCGMLPFADSPNQIYRLWLSLFAHAGLLHLLITLIFNFTLLRNIEKLVGCPRTAIIFLFSGMGGNLWSAVLLPYQIEVGPSGALFGVLAMYLYELLQSWEKRRDSKDNMNNRIRNPRWDLLRYAGLGLALFLIGLFPQVDNFAHIFGFLYGFALSVAFIPYATLGKFTRQRKLVQIIVSLVLVLSVTVLGFVLFFVRQEFDDGWVQYINCIPFTASFCSNFHSGQLLDKREGN